MKKTLYFKNDGEFEQYYAPVNGVVPSGEIAIIGNYEKIYTSTNNLDKTFKEYEVGGSSASGSININANGNGIDVASYATANVNVPVPAGYIVPTGSYSITENGNGIDISSYATVNVSVAGSTPSLTWLNSTTAGTWGSEIDPNTAVSAPVTVGKTYRIHFDGADYSSAWRGLRIWGSGESNVENFVFDINEYTYGLEEPLNDFDITILPVLYDPSEGGSNVAASLFTLRIAIVDTWHEGSQTGATYAFRYAELPAYPAGGPTT